MATTFQGGPGKVPAQRAGPTVARPRPGSPAMLQMMQRSAGNAAVASYVQRLVESPGPVRPTDLAPSSDPRFLAVTSKVASQGRALRQHPSPRAEVEKVKNAAVPPAGDKEAQAKEAQAVTMAGAKPADFDKAGFIAAVKAAIAAQAPKSLEEAEEFAGSGKAETVKNQVAGKVTDGKAASAKDIADKTAATPDESKALEKPVTPLAPEAQPASVRIDAAAGMPSPAPRDQTDLSAGKRDTDAAMAEADVSEQQLANSNEPEFVGAVAAKKAGEDHSASAPAAFRETEAAQLGSARQSAQGAGAAGLGGMLSAKKGALGKAAAAKGSAKSKDEAERAKVAGEVKAIFDATKKDVDAILGSLDGTVSKEFSEGEKTVRDAFTADVKRRMADYKKRRYSGWDGDLLWAKDKIFNLPKEADHEYVAARLKYESDMAALIGRVADTIGAKLMAAKDRISKGRADIKAYVDSRPKNLQKVAQAAAAQFADQFDQLESDVDSKKDTLVDDLAAKYVESRTAVDAEITAMQEENKGLWDKAKDAVGGAIKTVLQLKDMLLNVLARAVNAVGKIIKDPIGFLSNFVNAVKGGIVQFGQNIAEHLKKGLQGWLLGALAEGGIELPARFDLKGIVQLLMSIFGLTLTHIKARIVAKIGAPAMEKVMHGFTVIKILVAEGIGGLWKWVQEKVGDVKAMIMGKIKEMVSIEIIKAGIVWLISMLNPASAFVKACKMIYDVVMFFVEKADQIKAFVDSVLDSVESIAAGGVGAVAGHIEKTLARMLPVLIGFLASLLGLGGISGKIMKLLETLQKPINAVVDWVVTKAIKYGRKFIGFAKKVGGKVKAGGARIVGKIRQAGERLGIVKRPLNAGNEHHTLSVDPASGQIRMASKEAPIKQKIRERVNLYQARWKAEKRLMPDVESHVALIMSQVDLATARIQSAKQGKGPVASGQLDMLTPLVVDLLIKIGSTSSHHEDRPDGLGRIQPHGDKPPSGSEQGRDRTLESEHVIPVRVISTLFEKLGESDIIERGSGEDKRQHTIMIYKTAAERKTRGTESADHNLINQLKSIAHSGVPTYKGRNILARRLNELPPEAQEKVRVHYEHRAERLRETLVGKLPGIFAGRVKITHDAVKSDHGEPGKADARGHESPLPTEDKIRAAAALQAQDIVEIFSGRLRNL